MATVYAVTNKVTGDQYIGVTRFRPEQRWTQHKYKAKTSPTTYFHNSINKYGEDAFDVTPVASVIGHPSEVEQEVIKSFEPVYNMTNGGEITVGKRVPREVVEQIRQKNVGLKRSDETKAKLSAAKNASFKRNPEYLAQLKYQLREASKKIDHGKRIEAVKRAAREGKMSHPLSDEQKAIQLKRLQSPETRAKAAASKCKRILCVTTGKEYPSLIACAAELGLSYGNISRVCLGKRTHTHDLIFKYVTD